jgi:hypothetical protein
MLFPVLLAASACAETERVEADPDEIEAAVQNANDQAAATKGKKGA